MTTSIKFEKVNDIFNCELTLLNDEKFIIPMRKDGYIHATSLCKASNKRLTLWKSNKETFDLINTLSLKVGIPTSALIEIHKGGNNKTNQGTWIHPDLGIHLAQWCNPSFSLQVSKWVRELIITNKVEIGKEKSVDEIKEEYEKKISEIEEKHIKELEEKTKIIMTQGEKNLLLSRKYDKVYYNHQTFLRKKDLYKLKRGGCIYLVLMNEHDMGKRIKVGLSKDITERVASYRTSNPFCKLLFVMYTEHYALMETTIKRKYDKELNPNNREFIKDIETQKLIESIKEIATILNIDYILETEEELEQFNAHHIKLSEIEQVEEKEEIITKRCGGMIHQTEESRFLPLSKFFKNCGNEDGVNRLCKDCYLTGVYGDKRKVKKVVEIPEYDKETHKWCNLCESIKELDKFHKTKDTKDGLCANCKSCKAKQKKEYLKKRLDNNLVNLS
jgi:hypothetical protein